MSATSSIYIEAPVQRVFDFVKDPRKAWAASNAGDLVDVTMTEQGLGSYYSWVWNLPGGLRWEGFQVYTEFVPNQRITDRSSKPFIGTWTTTFASEGSGTRLTAERHPGSSRLLRPLDRLTDRVFRQIVSQRSLDRLKALLEEPAAPAAELPQPRAGATGDAAARTAP